LIAQLVPSHPGIELLDGHILFFPVNRRSKAGKPGNHEVIEWGELGTFLGYSNYSEEGLLLANASEMDIDLLVDRES